MKFKVGGDFNFLNARFYHIEFFLNLSLNTELSVGLNREAELAGPSAHSLECEFARKLFRGLISLCSNGGDTGRRSLNNRLFSM